MAQKKITKDMTIVEILNLKPESQEIMQKYGLHCFGCGGAMFETLELGCLGHGMDQKIISKMVKEINEI